MSSVLIILFLLASTTMLGQENLIPNPSFEEYIDFENIDPGFSWNKCQNDDTPDQFMFTGNQKNVLSSNSDQSGPLPKDGNSYIGIFCYRTNPLRGVSDVREILQVKLKEPLMKDSLYTLSFCLALDPESTHAIKNMNVSFKSSLSNYRRIKHAYQEYSQIRFRELWLSDTSWVTLQKDFKARGTEKYMVLGNLVNDNSTPKKKVTYSLKPGKTEKWNLYQTEEASYYYFDDFSLKLKSEDTDKDKSSPEPPPELKQELINELSIPDSISIEEVRRDTVFILQNIYFEFDKAVLLPESTSELKRLLVFLNKYPDISILIEGHTDNRGTYEYNMKLSIDRAAAVVEYLRSNGIKETRLDYIGYGYSMPVKDNTSNENRGLNRRVAFRIIDQHQ